MEIFHIVIFFPDRKALGKSMFAREFANAILCGDGELTNNPDYFEIGPDGNSIKIEQIRAMQKKVLEKPIVAKRKVYIINNSELMTKEAGNSLLKTLEEPPVFVCIILVSSNENMLLTTIKSRCIKISFNKLTDEELKRVVDVAESIIKVADGNVNKALELKEKEELFAKVNDIFENIENMNIIDIINSKDEIFEEKENAIQVLEYINWIFFNKLDGKYAKCIELIENTKERLKKNNNFDMTIDRLLFKTWEILQ